MSLWKISAVKIYGQFNRLQTCTLFVAKFVSIIYNAKGFHLCTEIEKTRRITPDLTILGEWKKKKWLWLWVWMQNLQINGENQIYFQFK